MGRPRAGHGWTAKFRDGKRVDMVFSDDKKWVGTGVYRGCPRCTRCRRPYQISPGESGLCGTCYFYKGGIPAGTFWMMKDHPQFPYSYGEAMMKSLSPSAQDPR